MSQGMVHLGPTLDLPFLFEELLSIQNFLHGIHKTFLKFGASVLVCVCDCSATKAYGSVCSARALHSPVQSFTGWSMLNKTNAACITVYIAYIHCPLLFEEWLSIV